MYCYNCGVLLSEHDFCTACGADVALYKKIMAVSNMYYNEGLERANVRDLTGAVSSLRQSLKFNKNNIEARNLLGLVYFEMGEVVSALSEWVISKNLRPEKNIADDFIAKLDSNAARLQSINSTIKKYNLALNYCRQDNKDLAVIQLKKVLSVNPKFVRAHLLLGLLFMDGEKWDYAQREVKKCLDIDRNNTLALHYQKEIEHMLQPDETSGKKTEKKSEDSVRYTVDNEMIIQPVNVKEPKSGGVSALLYIAIGLVIGFLATLLLMVPAAKAKEQEAAQKTIAEISDQSSVKTARIQELEAENKNLNDRVFELETQMLETVGQGGSMTSLDELLVIASAYIQSGDKAAASEALDTIAATVNLEETSESFKTLYQTILNDISPEMYDKYYNEGHDAYTADDYTTAITALSRAVKYSNANADAYYFLARAYHKSGNEETAIDVYYKVLELFPDSNRVADATKFLKALGEDL